MDPKLLARLSMDQIDQILSKKAKLYSEGIFWKEWNGSDILDREVDGIDIGDGIEFLNNKATWKKISLFFGKIPEIVVIEYFENRSKDDYEEIIKCAYKQTIWVPPFTMARKIYPKRKLLK